MDIFFIILVGLSFLLGGFLIIGSIYGFIKGVSVIITKGSSEPILVKGKASLRWNLYYLIAGSLWFGYALWRLGENLWGW